MEFCGVYLILLCVLLCVFGEVYSVEDRYLTLSGAPLQTDHIRISDIGLSDDTALTCWNWNRQYIYRPVEFSWYHKLRVVNAINNNGNNMGWQSKSMVIGIVQKLILTRMSGISATEGTLSCRLGVESLSVEVHFPILSLSTNIEIINGRNGTFKVICTSFGGRPLSMSLTGPSGETQEVVSIGTARGIGNDTFSGEIKYYNGGRDEDRYNCNASNVVSNVSQSSTLAVPFTPTLHSVTQTSSSSVRVEWSQPSGGATVTGYVVHYSDGDTRNESVPASSTSYLITGLTNCTTYNFSVEATSKHLSGESDILTIEIGSSSIATNIKKEVVSPTVISVKWDLLRACSPVGDLIVKYRVQYTAESSGELKSVERSGQLSVTRVKALLTGLTPYTNYSIRIATVNEHGVAGLYSYPITIQTPEDVPGVVSNVMAYKSLSPINISWTPPLRPNGVIIAYEVSYRPADSSDPETRLNTTDLETSFTTQSDLEEGTEFIFSVRAYTRVGPGNTSSITVSILSGEESSKESFPLIVLVGATASVSAVLCVCIISILTNIICRRHSNRSKSEINGSTLPGENDTPSFTRLEMLDNGRSQYSDKADAEVKTAPIHDDTQSWEEYPMETNPEFKGDVHFHPLPSDEFGDHVARCHLNTNQEFEDQFASINGCDEDLSETIGTSQHLKKLNRFRNITVYDNNRIILRPIQGHLDCEGDFINASYIDGYKTKQKFIATQGPLHRTAVDFWRMLWQERSQTIVMLANLVEGDKIKCHKYWPETGTLSFGPFNVTITAQQILADYTTREFSVQLSGGPEHAFIVTQFHFTAWPDHGVPDYATSLLAFHRKVKKHHMTAKGPMIVHCSAGVGRTGTLIAIDCVLDQLQEEVVVDIASVIIHLRTQRMKMVQTLDQYILIHDAILEFIMCGNTQIAAGKFHKHIKKVIKCGPQTHLNEFENQFKVLDKLSPKPRDVSRSEALQNPTKNRNNHYLPSDDWRVILRENEGDYIHAVFVNGYKQRRAFIIAQSPMESTARDFWKMIYDSKCGVIVMLCDLMEDGEETCYQYWPKSGMIEFGEYAIDLMEERAVMGFFIRKLSLYDVKTGSTHQAVQLHMTNWSSDGQCSNLSTITSVMREMTDIQMRTGNHPIIVHCSDTVSRSGMFCAIATTIERCKTEGVVDVFQVVKALRVQKPGAVPTVAQYRLLFEAVAVYLQSFDTYSNFLSQ